MQYPLITKNISTPKNILLVNLTRNLGIRTRMPVLAAGADASCVRTATVGFPKCPGGSPGVLRIAIVTWLMTMSKQAIPRQ